MLRPLIWSATTGPDVQMVMSSAYLTSLMFVGDVGQSAMKSVLEAPPPKPTSANLSSKESSEALAIDIVGR